jgi:CRISPR-associated protein Cas1
MIRVMALHAMLYCERLFYLEEVEEILLANDPVYQGRELHSSLEADEEGETVQLELESENLGIYGRVDCVKRRDGSWLPFEHKRGRPYKREDGSSAAWPSDRIQIIAYSVLLEETYGQTIPEGRIRYHRANVTVRIPIDDVARQDLLDAISRARTLRETVDRPAITENEHLCTKCSLAPVCLPEEVRHERNPEHQVTRLFPPDRDGTTLHVISQGTKVGCSGTQLIIRPQDEPEVKHPVSNVDTILLHGFTQISTQALRLCMQHEIGVHWLSMSGYHMASTVPTAGKVQRRVRQYKALTDDETCLRLARALVYSRVAGQLSFLLRASRSEIDTRTELEPYRAILQQTLAEIPKTTDRDSLRGFEGSAAVAYFAGLRCLLNDRIPEELRFENRNRRPPIDRFNALLGYGYGLLHTAVMSALLASGLEPALGFYHTPRSAAYPLVLDLMELFRVPLWDMVLIASLNRGQWDLDQDFQVTKTKVWLSDAGRKKAIGLFESRLQETWKHPVLEYSLSYHRTIELEARLLEKEWTGEPGLFAQLRLR